MRRDELACPCCSDREHRQDHDQGHAGFRNTRIVGIACFVQQRGRSAAHRAADPADRDALVVEMGSRGRGHLDWLMPAVRPDVAVITNLGVVISRRLATLPPSQTPSGRSWRASSPEARRCCPPTSRGLPGNTAARPSLSASTRRRRRRPRRTFRRRGRARFTLAPPGDARRQAETAGIHQPANAAAAAAAALAVGTDLDAIAIGLAAATGSKWRMEIHEGAFTVVNDAYNANPTSVESALRTVLHARR